MKTDRVRFYVEKNSFGVQAMTILMSLSAVFRLIGCWGLWNDRNYAVMQIALPVLSALLLILSVWAAGKKALWLSFIPVVLGAVFFIIKSLSFESTIHTVLCIILYVGVIALYFCTAFGILRTKWILTALFCAAFLYHVFVEDLAALRDTANPVSFAAGMQEMGVLCIILGLFFLCLSMKKSVLEPQSILPAIRKPKVIVPEGKPEEAQPDEAASEEVLAQTSSQTVPEKDPNEAPAARPAGAGTAQNQESE